MILSNQIYQSKLLSDIPQVIHGFTTINCGDMRESKNRRKINSSGIYLKQVHGNAIYVVTKQNYAQEFIEGYDGAVYAFDPSIEEQPILLVHVADCVPILAIDPINRVIGVAHAGWQGTYKHIMTNLIKVMVNIGAVVQSTRIVIGPHICGKCYEVDAKRASVFAKEFPIDVIIKRDSKLFLDLTRANLFDAVNNSIIESHIDVDNDLCTFHRSDELFSYRKNNKCNVGEIMGYIGFK